MMDNDNGIEGCTGQLASHYGCNPNNPFFYEACPDQYTYYI
jgi:hypothetical protein